MSIITKDCMRRALLLADWVKEHQEQCWRFFRPEEKAKQADPIERAIMQVVVDEAARIEADGWKISNERLFSLVESKLGMPGLSDRKMGKAASGLGLTPTLLGERRLRGRLVTREIIHTFKTNVSHVSHVSPCCGSKMNRRGRNVSETSHKCLTAQPAGTRDTDLRHVRDMTETCAHQHKAVAPQGTETCETFETCDPGYLPEFDFNDPNFPDEVII